MKGMTVEIVASSWIEALGGLSRWVTRSVPPAFCADAGAAAPDEQPRSQAAMNTAASCSSVLACDRR